MDDVEHPTHRPPIGHAFDSACQTSIRAFQVRSLCRNWAFCYVLNLPVCLYYGSGVTEDGGRVGMFAGILTLFTLGFWVCWRSLEFGRTLVLGGFLVALTQVVPLCQILAGVMAISLVVEVSETSGIFVPFHSGTMAFYSGLIVTCITGGFLITLALVVGLVCNVMIPIPWWNEHPRIQGHGKEPLPDELYDFR